MRKVIGNRILVQRLATAEAVSKGGIVMPAQPKEGGRDTQRGRVLAVGKGTWLQCGKLVPVDVQPGDVVDFYAHVGGFIRDADHGDEVLVIAEADVLAVERTE